MKVKKVFLLLSAMILLPLYSCNSESYDTDIDNSESHDISTYDFDSGSAAIGDKLPFSGSSLKNFSYLDGASKEKMNIHIYDYYECKDSNYLYLLTTDVAYYHDPLQNKYFVADNCYCIYQCICDGPYLFVQNERPMGAAKRIDDDWYFLYGDPDYSGGLDNKKYILTYDSSIYADYIKSSKPFEVDDQLSSKDASQSSLKTKEDRAKEVSDYYYREQYSSHRKSDRKN